MAIQAADLRLNNWILDHKGTPRQVAYVGETIGLWLSREDGTTQKYQEKPIYSCNIEKLSPIPLDADILEKCGAKVSPGGSLYINIKEGYSLAHFMSGEEGVGLFDSNDYWTGFSCKHLHELMNLHYALTGEELTIYL